ncbi:MAG: CehA/McbA family metallohydrolase [Anaerolineae bacterium]
MMDTIIYHDLFIEHDREGTYFTLPFEMPPDTETLTISYQYGRYAQDDDWLSDSGFISRREINIVDLGLISPDGTQVGFTGSDKTEISVSATSATPGYKPCELVEGEWQIMVGAYHIAPEGVKVHYEISCDGKSPRWLKGDLHAHTLASDGVLTAEELGRHAVRHGLEFVAITDHNNFNTAGALPHIPGLTFIPGVEWTHYQGHANFLGSDKPYDQPFFTNAPEESLARFTSARDRGALITINHPFEPGMGFQYDLAVFPHDCLETWNGPMREPNLRALAWWQGMLAAGKRVPICGGSDYHRDSPLQLLGGPTNCVFAMSASPQDILSAFKLGHSYIIYAPNGPTLELTAGDAIMGDVVAWSQIKELQVTVEGLLSGDVIRVVTGASSETLLQAVSAGSFSTTYTMPSPGFARIEVLRSFVPGLPLLPALLSNPIYFDGQG